MRVSPPIDLVHLTSSPCHLRFTIQLTRRGAFPERGDLSDQATPLGRFRPVEIEACPCLETFPSPRARRPCHVPIPFAVADKSEMRPRATRQSLRGRRQLGDARGPKGRHPSAQAIGLGRRADKSGGLKGRHNPENHAAIIVAHPDSLRVQHLEPLAPREVQA